MKAVPVAQLSCISVLFSVRPRAYNVKIKRRRAITSGKRSVDRSSDCYAQHQRAETIQGSTYETFTDLYPGLPGPRRPGAAVQVPRGVLRPLRAARHLENDRPRHSKRQPRLCLPHGRPAARARRDRPPVLLYRAVLRREGRDPYRKGPAQRPLPAHKFAWLP